MRMNALACALVSASACLAHAASNPTISPTPSIPAYGQPVSVDVENTQYPFYLPATNFVRNGFSITVDYTFSSDGWTAGTPAYAWQTLDFGELPPGNYTLTARLHDQANPGLAPQVATNAMPVMPPASWGIYAVPRDPDAFTPLYATIRSAAYFDPSSMRVSVSGATVRVDFDYYADAPATGAAPAGAAAFGSVLVDGLAPGSYQLEGWGTPKTGGAAQRYFTQAITVASTTPVVEYYAPSTGHYFMTAGPTDKALLDPGTAGWMRTGQHWKAWLRAQDAPPGAMPVCRFYAGGPNSHFYTASAADCQGLKDLEQQQRAQASAAGQPFLGWGFEQIAFYALVPVNGQCPGGTTPVYRAYNNRFQYNDSNHRFMADSTMLAAQLFEGWSFEGAQFCSPA
ncbi:MAG TPA: hypothetical protein VHP55_05780 [Usitatibacter sp.]|nr:hypothetical protein [Usitatibacter sp.]